MKFTYKTEKELSEMAQEEREAYLTEKREFEANQTKEQIESAKSEIKTELDKDLEEKLNAQKKESEKTISGLQETIKKLEKSIEDVGKNISKKTKAMKTSVLSGLIEQIKPETEKDSTANKLEGRFRAKDWDSEDTLTVGTVDSGTYPSNGSTSNANGVLAFFSRLIPVFYRKPRPISKIYDYVNVEMSDGELSYTVMSEEFSGEAELTAECALKPMAKLDIKPEAVNMEPIAVFWKMSRQFARMLKKIGVDIAKRYEQLIMEKVPSAILEAVKAKGVSFTVVPELQTDTDPNNFDAVISLIASLEMQGFVPNVVLVSPIAYANMLKQKASDGHYMLQNGGSIKIVGSTIDYGGTPVELVKDPTLGADEVIVGDLLSSVNVQLDSNIEYYQGYNNDDDMRRNLVGNVLEKYAAIIIPNGAELGIINETFSNVKTLITKSA